MKSKEFCLRSKRDLTSTYEYLWASQGVPVVRNLPANAGDTGSIPGSGRSPEEAMATHSRIVAQRIPWTEEAGGLQSKGRKESDRTEAI